MLTLRRTPGQRVRIEVGGDVVWVTYDGRDGKGDKLTFHAPPNVRIDREEIAIERDKVRSQTNVGS